MIESTNIAVLRVTVDNRRYHQLIGKRRNCPCGYWDQLSAPFNKYDNVSFAVFVPSLLCSLWEGTDLPRKSPYRIVLTKQEREELERRANKYTLPYFIVARF